MFSSYKDSVVKLEISKEVKDLCWEYARGLDEHRTSGRHVGRFDDLFRSCIGQEIVRRWLEEKKIAHKYMKPYHSEGRPANEFDILIGQEEFDVKTRSRWKEEYCHNIELLIGEHEQEEHLKVDYYIFCTTDEDLKYIYILGGLSYNDLWETIHEPKEFWDNAETKPRKYLFPTVGYILSRELDSLKKIIFRV